LIQNAAGNIGGDLQLQHHALARGRPVLGLVVAQRVAEDIGMVDAFFPFLAEVILLHQLLEATL
jgi:hypothetical protein